MSSRGAFTLIEMLVALAVTSVLTVMMLQMFTDSSAIWQREDQRLETFRESRAALQLISRELATVLPLPSGAPAATPTPGAPATATTAFPALALRGRTARPAGSVPTEHFTSVYALSAIPNSGASDLCAIGYFLEWDNGGPDPATGADGTHVPAYRLKRQFGESNNTFARLRTALNASAPRVGQSAFDVLYSPAQAPALPAEATQVLASYIWDLEFAVPDPALPKLDTVYFGNDLPQWIEVRFRALGATSGRKLADQGLTEAIWNDPANPTYERLIRPGEQQFVSRIKLCR
jgi:prepilin-type N-terminal cleavage/methylation domain-containing protein